MERNLNFIHSVIGGMEMIRGWFKICLEVELTNGLNLEDEVKREIEGVTVGFWPEWWSGC